MVIPPKNKHQQLLIHFNIARFIPPPNPSLTLFEFRFFFYIYSHVQFLSDYMRFLRPCLNWKPLDLASISIIFQGISHSDAVLDQHFDFNHFIVVRVRTKRNIQHW